MGKKYRLVKRIDSIVTVVFYTVMFALIFIIVGTFTKEIHVHASERAIKDAMASGELSVMAPANNASGDAAASNGYEIVTEDETTVESVPLQVVPLQIVPCNVIVTENPISVVDSENNTLDATDHLFPVPLDIDVQEHIIEVCEDYQMDPALVISVIQRESGYDSDALGDNGASEGLMQIKRQYNLERMTRLGCHDLLDPKQNVTVGIDLLSELLNTYETVEMALMVYNAGATGANTYWFSQGIYSTAYTRDVLATMAELSV